MNDAPRRNEHGQPIGPALPGWKPPPRPPREAMTGRYCRVEPIDPGRHARELYDAILRDTSGRVWTYMTSGPFESFDAFRRWIEGYCLGEDPLFHTIIDPAGAKATGMASYMRIDPKNGAIEVGHILYSPRLQRSRAATETMYLMMKRAFDLGYRRYEWKCDSLNAASRAAAQRLGFSYEGTFRNAVVYKSRSRDTAWYSVIDTEWPALQQAFERWLDPGNFDANGNQRAGLSSFTAPVLKARG